MTTEANPLPLEAGVLAQLGLLLAKVPIHQDHAAHVYDALMAAHQGHTPEAGTHCPECGKKVRKGERRVVLCFECHDRHLSRIYRRDEYHKRIKADPEKMAAHRETARTKMRKTYERQRKARAAILLERPDLIPQRPKTGRPRLDAQPIEMTREVDFDGAPVIVAKVPRAEMAAPKVKPTPAPREPRQQAPRPEPRPKGPSGFPWKNEPTPDAVVVAIRDAYAEGRYTVAELAAKHRLTEVTVRAFIYGERRREAGGSRQAFRDPVTQVRHEVITTQRRADLNTCGYCQRKFKGDGYYCPTHEAMYAPAPSAQ